VEKSRSPQYPSLSLPQAIEMIEKLHKANRTSVISRETAAKDMGYTGLTGRSMTVIAALGQFGLVEKTGKGDIKVTRRAVDILHAVDEVDRAEAIQDAANAPALFQQLMERFPEGVPSQNALRSYLIQQDFGDVAIGPAINAYLETIAFAEKTKESGRSGEGDRARANAIAIATPENPMQPLHALVAQPLALPTPQTTSMAGGGRTIMSTRKLDPNEIYLDFRGGHEVHVEGILDLNGVLELEEKLKAVKMLLKPRVPPMPAYGGYDEENPDAN
jgi:hypothetical protein